uniref:uncharacterized protein C9orf40 homolog n=1 Tax=Scatophagus argus TaxID=75038 RepID=UPI001ED7EF7E|nr:uncharacterized protein C9orf40 homolog [Scatophagus argus]
MAKRRAEDGLLHSSPPKRCCRSLCSVDMQLGSMVTPSGGVSPPSLLALLGSRSRKRPYYFEEPAKQDEEALYRKATHCDTRKHAANVPSVQASGSFQDRRSSCSAPTSSKKRPREECVGPDTVTPKDDDKADDDTSTEDWSYNSFQYWRVPLPELDLTLLEDASDGSQKGDKSKVSSSDVMET